MAVEGKAGQLLRTYLESEEGAARRRVQEALAASGLASELRIDKCSVQRWSPPQVAMNRQDVLRSAQLHARGSCDFATVRLRPLRSRYLLTCYAVVMQWQYGEGRQLGANRTRGTICLLARVADPSYVRKVLAHRSEDAEYLSAYLPGSSGWVLGTRVTKRDYD